jgi:hypothetical protein
MHVIPQRPMLSGSIPFQGQGASCLRTRACARRSPAEGEGTERGEAAPLDRLHPERSEAKPSAVKRSGRTSSKERPSCGNRASTSLHSDSVLACP